MAVFRKNRGQTNKAHFVSTENMKQNCAGIEVYPDTEYAEGIKFQEADILIANIRPYLKKAWLATFSGACSADVLALCPVDILPSFLFSVIGRDSFFDYVMSGAKGSKMPRGDKTHIMTYSFGVPGCEEQKRISDMMALLDKRIDAQRRLVESLKSYKRGVSTAIFNESLHIGSDSKWKEFSLGDFCTVVMGQSPDSTTYNNDGLGLPLVQGNADIYEGVTWPQHFTSAPTKIATANSILLSVRAPVGSVSIANQTVCIGRGVCSITSENMDFLYQLLVHIQDKWKKIEQGGTFTAISGDDIRRFRVTIPCVSDQIIIGSFLGAIDSLINNNKAICVALSKLKSAFLQILFI